MRFRQMLGLVCMVALAVLAVVVPLALAQEAVAVEGTPITPDLIKTFFDANAILIMFGWGLIHKYVPALRNIPNALIPWVNLIGYLLTRLGAGALGVGVAHASGGLLASVPDAVGVLIGGFTSASWARLLYEGWGRDLLERMIGLKAPTPRRG